MRRLSRPPLDTAALRYLEKKQAEVAARPQEVEKIWKAARNTKTFGRICEALTAMFGATGRCFFCNDSLACDVDHFAPKQIYLSRAFKWTNFFFICTPCNRKKWQFFPLDATGRPLLINPTKTEPWNHLFYESTTGLLGTAFSPTGIPDVRGVETINLLETLNYEAIAQGRRNYTRRLIRRVQEYRNSPNAYHREVLLDEGAVENLYGLTDWFFRFGGRTQSPFSDLQVEHPALFNEIANLLVP